MGAKGKHPNGAKKNTGAREIVVEERKDQQHCSTSAFPSSSPLLREQATLSLSLSQRVIILPPLVLQIRRISRRQIYGFLRRQRMRIMILPFSARRGEKKKISSYSHHISGGESDESRSRLKEEEGKTLSLSSSVRARKKGRRCTLFRVVKTRLNLLPPPT